MSLINTVLVLGLAGAIACDAVSDKEVSIESVAGRFDHAEGLHWNHRSQKLFFVDIDRKDICRLDPATGEVTCAYISNGPVGFVIPVDDWPYRLVAGSGRAFVLVVWNDKSNNTTPAVQTLATVDEDHPGNRWNDGKADSAGRFWGGTIGAEVNERVVPNEAALYRIGMDFKPEKEISPVTNSNGLAWNLEDDTFYYIDTPTLKVVAFDFEPHSGNISNKRVVFDFEKNGIAGLPDGMTIDVDGNLWVAMYNGGTVRKIDPRSGELLKTIIMPAMKITTATFGGPLLDTLYVASSSRGLTDEELKTQPEAGSVFAVKNVGARGLIANEYRIDYSALHV